MRTLQFAALPSASAIASAVTFAVSAWFLVAGGLALAENPVESPAARAAATQPTRVVYAAPAVAIDPEARLVIVVEGYRV